MAISCGPAFVTGRSGKSVRLSYAFADSASLPPPFFSSFFLNTDGDIHFIAGEDESVVAGDAEPVIAFFFLLLGS